MDNNFFRELCEERNKYVADISKYIARDYGKIEGADVMLTKMIELLKDKNESQKCEVNNG